MGQKEAGKRRRSAFNRVLEELTRRIGSAQFMPGDFLPSERALATELGASRATLSAALDELRARGMVERIAGRGARIVGARERQAGGLAVIHWHWNAADSAGMIPLLTLRAIQERLMQLQQPYAMPLGDHEPQANASPPPLSADDMLTQYAGALFIESNGYEPLILELERRRFPVAVANLETDLPVTATWVDHRKATRSATQMLAGMGHRRIAYVGRTPDCLFYGHAFEGYRAGLKTAGLALDEDLVVFCRADDAMRAHSAYEAAKERLAQPAAPTAFVAARDVFAAGVCAAIGEAGKTVGRDVSVIGFDDVSWPGRNIPLATFRQPCRELGAVAIQMLLDRVVNGHKPPEQRELRAPFLLRPSVAPPPGEAESGTLDRPFEFYCY